MDMVKAAGGWPCGKRGERAEHRCGHPGETPVNSKVFAAARALRAALSLPTACGQKSCPGSAAVTVARVVAVAGDAGPAGIQARDPAARRCSAALAASLGPAGGVGLAGGVAARPAVSGIPGSVFGATGVFPVGARGFRLLAGAAGGLLEGGHVQFLLALDETLRVVEVLFGRQQVGMGPERIPRLVSPRLSQAAPDGAGLP